jgi:hypothetical protein
MDRSHGIKIQLGSIFWDDLILFRSSPKWAIFGEIQSIRTECHNLDPTQHFPSSKCPWGSNFILMAPAYLGVETSPGAYFRMNSQDGVGLRLGKGKVEF